MLKCETFMLIAVLAWLVSSTNCDERYLLYDVSPAEGFNLRRDVFMRVARLARKTGWTLVLPPWGPLPHWKSTVSLPWSMFFDLVSLNNYTHCIEFRDFLDRFVGDVVLDRAYLLRYAPLREDLYDTFYEVECTGDAGYQLVDNVYTGKFFGGENLRVRNLTCIELSGTGTTLSPLLVSRGDKLVVFHRAETILHDSFGDKEYWALRKSLVFAKELHAEANRFIGQRLANDKFLAVHLRRSDYPIVRPNDVPSIEGAAMQVKKLMRDRQLSRVFLATDGDRAEVDEFLRLVPEAVVYHNTGGVRFDCSANLIDNASGNLCENPHTISDVVVPPRPPSGQCSRERRTLDRPCTDGGAGDLSRCAPRADDTLGVRALPGLESQPPLSSPPSASTAPTKSSSFSAAGSVPNAFHSAFPSAGNRDCGSPDEGDASINETCQNPHMVSSEVERGSCADAIKGGEITSHSLEESCHHKGLRDPPLPGRTTYSACGKRPLETLCTKENDHGNGEDYGASCMTAQDAGTQEKDSATGIDLSCTADASCYSGNGKRGFSPGDFIEGSTQEQKPSLWTEGQIAIIDQIICSRAEVFVGSFESTFSFRIQEEREILGKSPDTTFNRLCADRDSSACQQPTRWTVVH